MKTREEVEKLKWSWFRDPNWDLETTDGFEEYKQELLDYRKETEAFWKKQTKERRSRNMTDEGIHIIFENDRPQEAIIMCLLRIAHALERIADQGETTSSGEYLQQSVEIFGAG